MAEGAKSRSSFVALSPQVLHERHAKRATLQHLEDNTCNISYVVVS
jgi:hypothetical protein